MSFSECLIYFLNIKTDWLNVHNIFLFGLTFTARSLCFSCIPSESTASECWSNLTGILNFFMDFKIELGYCSCFCMVKDVYFHIISSVFKMKQQKQGPNWRVTSIFCIHPHVFQYKYSSYWTQCIVLNIVYNRHTYFA